MGKTTAFCESQNTFKKNHREVAAFRLKGLRCSLNSVNGLQSHTDSSFGIGLDTGKFDKLWIQGFFLRFKYRAVKSVD